MHANQSRHDGRAAVKATFLVLVLLQLCCMTTAQQQEQKLGPPNDNCQNDPISNMLFELDLNMRSNDGLRLGWQLYQIGDGSSSSSKQLLSGGYYLNSRYDIRECLDPTVCYKFQLKTSQALSAESSWRASVDGGSLFRHDDTSNGSYRDELAFQVYFGSAPCRERNDATNGDNGNDAEHDLVPMPIYSDEYEYVLRGNEPNMERQDLLGELNKLGGIPSHPQSSRFSTQSQSGLQSFVVNSDSPTPDQLEDFLGIMEQLQAMNGSNRGRTSMAQQIVLVETETEAEPEVRRKQPTVERLVPLQSEEPERSNRFFFRPKPSPIEREEPGREEYAETFLEGAIQLLKDFLAGTASRLSTESVELEYASYPVHLEVSMDPTEQTNNRSLRTAVES